jgi:hypothetical protein
MERVNGRSFFGAAERHWHGRISSYEPVAHEAQNRLRRANLKPADPFPRRVPQKLVELHTELS